MKKLALFPKSVCGEPNSTVICSHASFVLIGSLLSSESFDWLVVSFFHVVIDRSDDFSFTGKT